MRRKGSGYLDCSRLPTRKTGSGIWEELEGGIPRHTCVQTNMIPILAIDY
jgi:hypothetical protein